MYSLWWPWSSTAVPTPYQYYCPPEDNTNVAGITVSLPKRSPMSTFPSPPPRFNPALIPISISCESMARYLLGVGAMVATFFATNGVLTLVRSTRERGLSSLMEQKGATDATSVLIPTDTFKFALNGTIFYLWTTLGCLFYQHYVG